MVSFAQPSFWQLGTRSSEGPCFWMEVTRLHLFRQALVGGLDWLGQIPNLVEGDQLARNPLHPNHPAGETVHPCGPAMACAAEDQIPSQLSEQKAAASVSLCFLFRVVFVVLKGEKENQSGSDSYKQRHAQIKRVELGIGSFPSRPTCHPDLVKEQSWASALGLVCRETFSIRTFWGPLTIICRELCQVDQNIGPLFPLFM